MIKDNNNRTGENKMKTLLKISMATAGIALLFTGSVDAKKRKADEISENTDAEKSKVDVSDTCLRIISLKCRNANTHAILNEICPPQTIQNCNNVFENVKKIPYKKIDDSPSSICSEFKGDVCKDKIIADIMKKSCTEESLKKCNAVISDIEAGQKKQNEEILQNEFCGKPINKQIAAAIKKLDKKDENFEEDSAKETARIRKEKFKKMISGENPTLKLDPEQKKEIGTSISNGSICKAKK
jgi:hypothetical protein